jgi:hypothetical protein
LGTWFWSWCSRGAGGAGLECQRQADAGGSELVCGPRGLKRELTGGLPPLKSLCRRGHEPALRWGSLGRRWRCDSPDGTTLIPPLDRAGQRAPVASWASRPLIAARRQSRLVLGMPCLAWHCHRCPISLRGFSGRSRPVWGACAFPVPGPPGVGRPLLIDVGAADTVLAVARILPCPMPSSRRGMPLAAQDHELDSAFTASSVSCCPIFPPPGGG